VDVSSENRGYDIESRNPADPYAPLRFIEVKGRAVGADEVTVTSNEMRYAANKREEYILAIVWAREDGSADGPYYVTDPFEHEPAWGVSRTTFKIQSLLERGGRA
jgi:hypothetical protein